MKNCAPFRFRVEEKGSAFFVVVLLAITSTAMIGAYLSSSLGKSRHVEQQIAEKAAFNAAESGLNMLIEDVWRRYRDAPPTTRLKVLDKLDGKHDPIEQLSVLHRTIGDSVFDVTVREVRIVGTRFADVEFLCEAQNRHAARCIMAVVRFGRKSSEVFDHAYFINNFGWLWGSGITVNGSVRSNGNFSVKGATVNGDIYASENTMLGAAGTVTGTSSYKSVAGYNAGYGEQCMPTDPSAPPEDLNGNGILDAGEDLNGNGVLDDFEYEGGYDGESERHEAQKVIDMPYLGDLSTYRELATIKGGTISQGGSVLVDAVLGDATGEPDRIILIGTAANPIVLDGPVVIEQDVVIKGVITGRGTIYAGRNVHIVDDLEYLDPPAWPKPLDDLNAVIAANKSKDAIGLAAKGSIIMGDYTQNWWKSSVASYQRPPFTQPYVVDPTDAANGYVSYHDADGNAVFNGDYSVADGGQKDVDGGVAGTVDRHYYESSFADDKIHAIAGASYLTKVDAILYTNHLLSGRIGSCTFNGTLVSRDEAIIYSGTVDMNYDVRMKDDGYEYIDIYLPRAPTYRILYWSEGRP